MQVRDAMSTSPVWVGPHHTLRAAARAMATRHVGAAVVLDADSDGPGILTERDILLSVGAGEDPDAETVANHLTSDVVYSSPEMSLEDAAAKMLAGKFRHLIVLEGNDAVGVISMRDVVEHWLSRA